MPTKLPILYYREFGVRKLGDLLNPKIINITDLPRKSTYHYCTYDPEACDIDVTLSLLNVAGASRIMTEYVEILTSDVGTPRKVAFQVIPAVRAFHKKNRKFKLLKSAAVVNANEKILNLVNYNYLQRTYAYVDNAWKGYNSWLNLTKTMFKNINRLCKDSTFNQFFTFDIPRDIPSRSMLEMTSNNLTTSHLNIFDTVGEKLILELWKWLNPETKNQSIFDTFEEGNLSKINIIFKAHNGKTCLINLGYMYSWIDGNPNLTPIKSLSTKRWQEVRKALLYFMLMMSNTLDDETDSEALAINTDDGDATSTVVADPDLDPSDFDEEDEKTESPNTLLIHRGASGNNNLKNVETVNLDKDTDIGYDDSSENKFKDIDSVLDDLEKAAKIRLKRRGIKTNDEAESPDLKKIEDATEVEARVFTRADNIQELQNKIDSDVEFGILTAADMRKHQKDIDKYLKMPDPYGTGKPIVQAKEIKPEELLIDENKSVIPTSKLVRDDSMKKSSLISFEEDYIDKVMTKDILNAVDALQRSGVVIRDYEIKEENSILGSYEVHSVELKPIDGAVSTIHFRIPKVNKDGTFTVNGNKYVFRKQRVD